MKKLIAAFVLLFVSAAAFSAGVVNTFTDKGLTISGIDIEKGIDYDIGTYSKQN